MKAKTVLKKLGGQAAATAFATKVTMKYGVQTVITPHVNEEKPSDNWLNVLFETPNGLFDKNGFSNELIAATGEVEDFLAKHGLGMEYECGGDGETGPIDSWRVY